MQNCVHQHINESTYEYGFLFKSSDFVEKDKRCNVFGLGSSELKIQRCSNRIVEIQKNIKGIF